MAFAEIIKLIYHIHVKMSRRPKKHMALVKMQLVFIRYQLGREIGMVDEKPST